MKSKQSWMKRDKEDHILNPSNPTAWDCTDHFLITSTLRLLTSILYLLSNLSSLMLSTHPTDFFLIMVQGKQLMLCDNKKIKLNCKVQLSRKWLSLSNFSREAWQKSNGAAYSYLGCVESYSEGRILIPGFCYSTPALQTMLQLNKIHSCVIWRT